MIAAVLGGRGADTAPWPFGFWAMSDYDAQLETATHRLLALGSASADSRFATIDGRRLHYLEAGAGEPLLLLHGAGGGAANWYRLIAPLAEQYRVLAPDLPGFAFSDPINAGVYLGRQVGELIAAWLQSIGVARAKVVGTSFGGLVALRLAESFDTPRVVVTDTVGLASRTSILLRLATLPFIARLVIAPSRRGTRVLLRRVLTSTPLRAADEHALAEYLYWSAKRNDSAAMARAFTRFASMRGQRDVVSVDQLRRLADRLLLIWGERDRFLPLADIQQNCALAGCREVRIIPGAGHSPNWERPEMLLDIIRDFLNE